MTAEEKITFERIEDEIPVVPGGLTDAHIEMYKKQGWVLMRTTEDTPDWPMSFGTGVPGEVVVKYGTIPKGTIFLANFAKSLATVPGCGNP